MPYYDPRYCDEADIAEQMAINRMQRRMRANMMLDCRDPDHDPCPRCEPELFEDCDDER